MDALFMTLISGLIGAVATGAFAFLTLGRRVVTVERHLRMCPVSGEVMTKKQHDMICPDIETKTKPMQIEISHIKASVAELKSVDVAELKKDQKHVRSKVDGMDGSLQYLIRLVEDTLSKGGK